MKPNSKWFESWPASNRDDLLRNYRRVFGAMARRKSFNDADANDIAQKTIAQIAVHSGEFDPQKDLWPWACKFCRNVTREQKKSKRRIKNSAVPLSGHEVAKNNALAEPLGEALSRAEAALFGDETKLDGAKRGARLVIFHGYKTVEIADELGTTATAIYNAVLRSKKQLREILMRESHECRQLVAHPKLLAGLRAKQTPPAPTSSATAGKWSRRRW